MNRFIQQSLLIFFIPIFCALRVGRGSVLPSGGTEINRHVLAFYYSWYGNPHVSREWVHWADVSQDAIGNSTDYPVLGAYDSHDPKVIEQQCKWAKQSGITGLIASWWGEGDFTDQALPLLLTVAGREGLKVTVYIERARARQPSAEAAEVLYLLHHYGSNPAWLRLEDKPVLFVYGRAIDEIGLNGWRAVRSEVEQVYPGGVSFIADQISDRAARVFDGLHEYNYADKLAGKSLDEIRAEVRKDFSWSLAKEKNLPLRCLTVLPGYDDHKQKERLHRITVERRSGETYQILWQEAIRAKPDWVLIASWNEWHEGSEIEPSREYGERFLQITAEFSKRFLAR